LLSGIFVDEASTSCALAGSYYTPLRSYIQIQSAAASQSNAFVAINPGMNTSECYVVTTNAIVTFEGTCSSYENVYTGEAWTSAYPPSLFWHICYHSAGTTSDLASIISLAKRRGAGSLYVTTLNLPNPYGALPPTVYWQAELSLV